MARESNSWTDRALRPDRRTPLRRHANQRSGIVTPYLAECVPTTGWETAAVGGRARRRSGRDAPPPGCMASKARPPLVANRSVGLVLTMLRKRHVGSGGLPVPVDASNVRRFVTHPRWSGPSAGIQPA